MNDRCWFTLDDTEKLSARQRVELTKRFYNPGMAAMLGLLRFDQLWPVSASGSTLVLEDGCEILDVTGGNCVMGLGHNHPRILAARQRIANAQRAELCKSFLSPYQAALAANMANLLPGDLQYSYFCNSGAEANESALKLAQKHHGPDRRSIVYMDRSFHGKTTGAMSVSSMDLARDHFRMLDQCYQAPYGDADALDALLAQRAEANGGKADVCAVILEAVHGTQLIFPPDDYLSRVREICTRHDALMIVDEIYVGFGRTGHWFAFQVEDVVPDIVTYSKTFGGGKATIAGFTAREDVFKRAYGNPGDSMLHSSTFAGMTEECATAIEAVNVIRDEELVELARKRGAHLEARLRELRERRGDRILDVRGRGLLWGIELAPAMKILQPLIGKLMPGSEVLHELTGAVALSELLHAHGVLAYLGFTRRNLVVFSPPLNIDEAQLDRAVDALDRVLSASWVTLGTRFAARAARLSAPVSRKKIDE